MRKNRHVVIIGAGFGGLKATRILKKRKDLEITLIDKTNHHLFQPLLYQVATAALAPGDIAVPARSIFKKDKNVHILMGEVTRVDKHARQIHLENGQAIAYDYLILAPGARHSYFGNEEWEKRAPGLKTLSDALSIRENILLSFEKAEREPDPEKRKRYETFVVVGGGSTGVEVVGAIAEISTKTMRKEYENVDLDLLEIFLVEGRPEVLNTYHNSLSQKALQDLEKMGVTVLLNSMVTKIDEGGVLVKTAGGKDSTAPSESNKNGSTSLESNKNGAATSESNRNGSALTESRMNDTTTSESNNSGATSSESSKNSATITESNHETSYRYIEADTVIWAAGNAASPLLKTLGLPLEKDGRLRVESDLSIPAHPEVFVIGDAALHIDETGRSTPAIAPGALQQGEHAARMILKDISNESRRAFSYFDKGSMATIGRARAIAEIGKWRFSGFFAWLMWSLVHVFFLIGFRNRFRVMVEWLWYYLTFRGGSRLISRGTINESFREVEEKETAEPMHENKRV